MNKNNVFSCCISLIYYINYKRNLHWNNKIANATGQASEIKKTKVEVKENGVNKAEKKQDVNSSFNEAYAKNLPDAVKEKLKKAAAEKKQ